MEKQLNYLKIGLVALSGLMIALFWLDSISLESLIKFSLGLLILIVVATIGAALLNFAENPNKGFAFIGGLVVLLLIFGISYGVSTDAIDVDTEKVIEGSRTAEAGIYTLYVLIVLAIGALFYSSAKRIFS